MHKYLLLFCLFSGIHNSYAQTEPKLTRLLFIFDFSNSMNSPWESSSRISIAKKLMNDAIDSLKNVPNLEIALRLYGHQTPLRPDFQDCNDTKLEVPFGPGNHQAIKTKITSNYPKGTTPIAISLEKAGGDFPECSNCRNVIVLITDGIEACDGDPCAVARALRSKNISVKPFIIGVGLDLSYLKTLECIGNVFDAGTENAFKNTLKVVIDQAVNNTTAQVNLLDVTKRATETNVSYTIYDAKTGAIRYNYIHTMYAPPMQPDTIVLDAVSTYRIVVHTIPEVEKTNIKIEPGKHNIIEIDAPQGQLEIFFKGTSKSISTIPVIVRKNNEMTTLNVQQVNTFEKYIVGKYDLEILTLPRINMKNVAITQSQTNHIEIPYPGTCRISTPAVGYGAIFLVEGGQMVWVCNLQSDVRAQQFLLQPGKYRVVFRRTKTNRTIHSMEKGFEIKSAQTTTLSF